MDPQYRPSPPNNALAWALLSQAVWLPLLGLDLHDRWQAQIREQREIAAAAVRRNRGGAMPQVQRPGQPSLATAKARLTETGLLLGSASRSPLNPSDQSGVVNEPGLAGYAPSSRFHSPNPGNSEGASGDTAARPGTPEQSHGTSRLVSAATPGWQNPMLHTFNRAELLGGSLGLSDLNTAAMPPLAMAERARWQSSGDPLAPLPGAWREPMRRALHGLAASKGVPASITAARVVHVPSLRVRQSTPVPLAVQPDGSVDILTRPDNPAVVDEIRQWSSRQPSSGQAGVTAAVVHLEPLPEAPRESRPAISRTGSGASVAAPVATSSRPAPAEPAVAPSPPPVAAAPVAAAPAAPEPAPPPAAPAAAASPLPAGAGANLP